MADVVIREQTDEKGWIHRMEIPLKTFLREHDFEAVVRCKDCKWWKTLYFWEGHEHKICVRESHESLRNAEDFCSRGERKEDAETD